MCSNSASEMRSAMRSVAGHTVRHTGPGKPTPHGPGRRSRSGASRDTLWLITIPHIIETMKHALIYVGGFERNFPKLKNGATTFEGSDGQEHTYPAAHVNGLRAYFMEKAGKKFSVVRVADEKSDVVLENDLMLVPGEHFGFGTRLSGEPAIIDDDNAALKLLEDIIKKNRGVSEELLKMRARLKAPKPQ